MTFPPTFANIASKTTEAFGALVALLVASIQTLVKGIQGEWLLESDLVTSLQGGYAQLLAGFHFFIVLTSRIRAPQ